MLTVFITFFILSSCYNQNNDHALNKEEISFTKNNDSIGNNEEILFTNIKYLDTVQNLKPAAGIPEVEVGYWMKKVFKDIKNVKKGGGSIEFVPG